jgi:hypothetical protein
VCNPFSQPFSFLKASIQSLNLLLIGLRDAHNLLQCAFDPNEQEPHRQVTRLYRVVLRRNRIKSGRTTIATARRSPTTSIHVIGGGTRSEGNGSTT